MLSILFVFRKSNKGNFSIEKVFGTIYSGILEKKIDTINISTLKLKYNYDLLQFITSFFSSLFTSKNIIHITGACNYMIMAFPFKKKVLTIHDFYHYNRMKGIKGKLYDMFYFKLPIYFTNYIVVVSNKTKEDLLRFFPKTKATIEIIHNPLVIPSNKIIFKKRKLNNNTPFTILQIGDKPLKNYQRLIEATHEMNVNYIFIHSNKDRIHQLIQKYKLQNRTTVYNNLSDDELYSLYQSSDVLFFASEAEGFGLPIIEAQAFGLKVITSNIEPMSIIGKGAILVDPFSINSIKEGFNKLYDEELLEANDQLSRNNVEKFLAPKVVNDYLEFYKRIA